MLDTWEMGHLSTLEDGQNFQGALRKRVGQWHLHARRTLLGSHRFSYIREKLASRLRRLKADSTRRALALGYAVCRATGLPLPRSLNRPEDINRFVSRHYKPRPYPGRITLFRAEMGIEATDIRYDYAL